MAGPSKEPTIHVYSVKDEEFVPMLGLLDTGSTHNWISRDLIVRLGLRPVKLVEQADFVHFQGGTLTAYERVKLRWHGISKRVKDGYFTVAEEGPFDILFGADFLFYEGVLTYNEKALVIKSNDLTPEKEKERSDQIQAQKDAEAERQANRKAEKEAKGKPANNQGKGEGSKDAKGTQPSR